MQFHFKLFTPQASSELHDQLQVYWISRSLQHNTKQSQDRLELLIFISVHPSSACVSCLSPHKRQLSTFFFLVNGDCCSGTQCVCNLTHNPLMGIEIIGVHIMKITSPSQWIPQLWWMQKQLLLWLCLEERLFTGVYPCFRAKRNQSLTWETMDKGQRHSSVIKMLSDTGNIYGSWGLWHDHCSTKSSLISNGFCLTKYTVVVIILSLILQCNWIFSVSWWLLFWALSGSETLLIPGVSPSVPPSACWAALLVQLRH